MGPISIGFFLAALGVVALSFIAGRRHPSFRIALMLLTFWGVANLSDPWIDPWMDVAGYVATFGVWYGRRFCRWAVVTWLAFALQIVIHLCFIANPHDPVRYLLLNILYAAQLMATAFPGTMVGLRSLFRRSGGFETNHPGVARDLGRRSLSAIGHRRRRGRVASSPADLGSPR